MPSNLGIKRAPKEPRTTKREKSPLGGLDVRVEGSTLLRRAIGEYLRQLSEGSKV